MKGRNNGKDIDFGDLDLDNDLDIPGLSDDGFDISNDRKPSLIFKDSFKSTLYSKFSDRGLLRRLIGLAAPKGYSQAFNAYDGISRGLGDLYRDNQPELQPYLQKTGRLLERNAPRVLRALPRGLRDALTQKTHESNYKERTELDESLEGVDKLFKLELADKQAQRVKEATTEIVERKRFELQMKGNELLVRGVNRLVSYQDTILIQYHRKTLELGYRQYDASVRSLMESRAYYAETTTLLKSINKNSGLPDYVKMTHEEAIKDSLRRKLTDAMSGGIAGWAGDYWKNLQKRGGELLGGVLQGASMAGDFSSGMGMSKAQTAGLMMGTGAAEFAANRLEPFIEMLVSAVAPSLEKAPGVKGLGNWFRENLTAVPQKLNRWARSTTTQEGLMGEFIDGLKALLDQYDSGTKIQGPGIESLNDPAVFDRLFYTSVTEIMPGYMASMDKTLKEILTGTPQEEMAYSHYTGGMVSRSTLNQQNVRIGIKQSQGDNVRREVDGLMRELGAEQLTPEAKRILRRRLLSDLQSGYNFDPTDYVKYDSWPNANESVAEELIELFADKFALDIEGKFVGTEDDRSYRNDMVQVFDDISKRIPNSRQRMAVLSTVLGRRTLRELGLTKYDGVEGDTIDLDAFNKMILGEDIFDDSEMAKELRSVSKTRLDIRNPAASMRARKEEQLELIKLALEEKQEQELQAQLAGKSDNIDVSSIRGENQAIRGLLGGGGDDALSTLDIGTHKRLDTIIKLLAKQGGVPAFAEGGEHEGGVRLVGEDGPEIEVTGPSTIINARDTAKLLGRKAKVAAKRKIRKSKAAAKRYRNQAGDWIGDKTSPAARAQYRQKLDELVTQGREFYDEHTTDEAIQGYKDSATVMGEAVQDYIQELMGKGQRTAVGAKDRYDAWSNEKFGEGRNVFSPMLEAMNRQTILLAELVATNSPDGESTALSVMRRLFGSAGVLAGKTAGGLTDMAMWYGRKTLDFYKAVAVGGFRGSAMVGRGVKALYKPRNLGITDVYVEGGTEPVLQAKYIRAEYYRDVNTDKIIKSFKDITGPVIDTRNGEMALTESDFKKGLYKANGESLAGYVTRSAIGAGETLGRGVKSYLTTTYGMLWKGTKAVWNMGVDQFMQYDAYFPGETEPRIRSKLMAQDYYRDEKGDPISKLSDIKGAVYDRDGNVVISQEDFDKYKSLYTRNGSVLFTIGRGAASLGSHAIKLGLKGAIAYGRFTLDAYKWAGKKLWSGLKGIGGMFKGRGFRGGKPISADEELSLASLEIEMEQLKTQRAILEMVGGGKKDWLDTDGDGIRDNSWTDIMRKRKEKSGTKDGEEDSQDKTVSAIDRLSKTIEKRLTKLGDQVEDSGEEGGFFDSIMGLFGKGKDGKGKKGGLLRRLAGSGALRVGGAAIGGAAFLGAKSLSMDYLSEQVAKSDNPYLARTSEVFKMFGSPRSMIGAAGNILKSNMNMIFNGDYEDKPLFAARMTQYGVDPNDDSRVSKILALEDICRAGVVGIESGNPDLDPERFDITKVDSLFGIPSGGTPADNPEAAEKRRLLYGWLRWRFRPVFLAHCKALHKFGGTTDLRKADDYIKGEQLSQTLEIITVPGLEKVYDRLEFSPFEDELTEGYQDVRDAFFFVKRAANSTKALDAGQKKHIDGKLTETAKAATVLSVAQGGETDLDKITDDLSRKAAGSSMRLAGLSVGAHISQGGDLTGKRRSLNLSTAVRYLTYGLTELMLDKAEQLYKVEELFWDKVVFDGTTSADFMGDEAEHLEHLNAIFRAIGTEQRAMIRLWFQHRFRPVFLQYALGIRRNHNGSIREGVDKISGEALKAVLTACTEVTTRVEGVTKDVWSIPFSPWVGYALGSDPSVVLPYLKSIKTSAPGPLTVDGLDRAAEQGVTRKEDYGKYVTGLAMGAKLDEQGKQSTAGSILRNMQYKFGPNPAHQGGGLLTQGAGSYGTNVGNKVPHPGGGSGGDINMLPDSLGDGAAANRDLIMAAAKMVGFDPDIAMTVAGMESSWRPRAGAGTSSAKGLFQFIDSTWQIMLGKYARTYGINPNASPMDPKANAILGALYLKENYASIKRTNPDTEVTDLALYMAHFLGPGGAAKWLRQHPSTPASQGVYEYSQFTANRPVFTDKNGRELTVGETNANLAARIEAIRKTAGIGTSVAGSPTGGKVTGEVDAPASPVASIPDDSAGAQNVGEFEIPDTLKAPGSKPTSTPAPEERQSYPTTLPPIAPSEENSVAAGHQAAQQQRSTEAMGNMGTVLAQQLQRLQNIDSTLVAIKQLMERGTPLAPQAPATGATGNQSQTSSPAPSLTTVPRATTTNRRVYAE